MVSKECDVYKIQATTTTTWKNRVCVCVCVDNIIVYCSQKKSERGRSERKWEREREISSAIQNQFHLNQRINDSQKLDSLKYAHKDTIRARFRLKINAFAFVQSYEKKKFTQTKRFAHVDWHTKQLIAVFFYLHTVRTCFPSHTLSLSLSLLLKFDVFCYRTINCALWYWHQCLSQCNYSNIKYQWQQQWQQ